MDGIDNKQNLQKNSSRFNFSKRNIQKYNIIILFLLIPLILLIIFTYLPLYDMFEYSFYKWDGFGTPTDFVGFDNYKTIFQRPEYLKVLKTSIYYFVGSILQIILALYLAAILNKKLKGANFFKGVIFFPFMLNGVAIGLMFLYFFKADGILNTVLCALGANASNLPQWLGDRAIVNYSLVFVSLWRYTGQNVVMFNGAMQSVDTDILEAASIDGANEFKKFLYVILPNIKTIVSLNLILAVKGAISVYEIPYVMTGGVRGSETFVMRTLTTAFQNEKYGLASAMGVLLFLFIMIVTFVQKRFFEGKKEA